jgi:hypothetical protein
VASIESEKWPFLDEKAQRGSYSVTAILLLL